MIDSCPQTRVYNNIILGTNNNIGWISAITIGSFDYVATSASGVSVKNNIFYNPGNSYPMGMIHIYDSAYTNGFVSEGNVFYEPHFVNNPDWALDNNVTKTSLTFSQWQARGFDNAGFSAYGVNPLFIKAVGLVPSDFDLHVATNSPALKSPYSLPFGLRDAARVLRRGNSAWDRGAYQTIKTFQLSSPLSTPYIVP